MAQNEVTIATYMPAVTYAKALDVIKLVTEGKTLLQACEAMFIQTAQMKAMCKREPTLAQMLEEAEEIRDDILADILVDEAALPADAKKAAVISSNIRFILERRRPTKYGKQLEVVSSPESEQSKLLAEALRAAVDRIPKPAEPARPQITDATFTVVDKNVAAVSPPPPKFREETPGDDVGTIDGFAELKRLGLI